MENINAKGTPVSFVMACRDFFGLKPEQKLTEFAAEVKVISSDPALRAYFVKGLEQNGYTIQAATLG
jgi:hypothetical protein